MADVTQFKVQYVDSPSAGRLALVTMDNGHDWRKPNTFGEGSLRSMEAALAELEAQRDLRGVLLTGKPLIFMVGADLDAFEGADEATARAGGRAGHELFARLQALPVPTLAAINGACMGGGLEVALHCDYRTLSDAARPIAFPEVFLSILPGWGGTQLTPRLIGGPKALQVIVHNALDNNRVLSARQAVDLGLADELVPAVDFLDASFRRLEQLVTGELRVPERNAPQDGLDEALRNARAHADGKVHGATRAPYLAIELIEFAARGGGLAEGREREIAALAELLPSRQAQASVYAFQLTQQRVKRQPWKPDAQPRRVRKVAVIGSGLMGAQLGALLLRKLEVPLVMKDIDEGVLDHARAAIEGELDRLVQRGKLPQRKASFLRSAVTYTTEYEPVRGADFVLEAVLERMDLKQRVFADVEAVVDPGAVLATNTSSLSVTEMASRLQHPERVIGFHFFNPVAVLPLLEIVRTAQASDEAMATGFRVAKDLGKSTVQCADTPAFIVNRLLSRFMGACAAAVDQGNDFGEVDDAIVDLGLPMGPFVLMSFVGLRVAYHTLETLHAAFPDRFPLDENLRAIAEAGVDGIYDWSRGRVPHDEVLARWRQRDGGEKLTPDQIRQQALEATADEITHMLDERVVADARDIDTAMLLGAGWPFFLGGICKYLDQVGISEKVAGRRFVGDEDGAVLPTR